MKKTHQKIIGYAQSVSLKTLWQVEVARIVVITDKGA